MKNLNNRSTSSPSLRGVSITTKQSTAHSAVIPESLCRESVVRRSAFTLVELVIVIAIVIILSVVSVPIYRGYINNAKMSEGYALLGTILSAQKAYFTQYSNFLRSAHGSAGADRWTDYDEVLGIDARGNKYFTCFHAGVYGSTMADMKHYFGAIVIGPENLPGGNTLYLQYNITKGARLGSSSTHWW